MTSSWWYARPGARSWRCPPPPAAVQEFHASLDGYAPTPLTELPALAPELGVGRVYVKDESSRLGLPAFKALGVTWAVHRVLATTRAPGGGPLTLVTATDGNHGRAVARSARLLGQRASVFVPQGVHPSAVAAIAAEGAEVTAVAGPYDEAVRRAADAARGPGAVLVQDTAWPGYEEIPGWIVEGYSTLFAEVDAQLGVPEAAGGARAGGGSVRDAPEEGGPVVVVVPAGVGSLAQAAVTHYRSRPAGPGGRAAALMVVEPRSAACVLAGLVRGRAVTVATGETVMAGLNCGTPSSIAWPRLRDGLDAAVAVTDAAALRAARDLAALGVAAGPCGAASLAGARAALTGEGARERRDALGVHPGARVAPRLVLLNTEGPEANPYAAGSPA
ncbi:pyridoxal-phosphate dependent enzyme [Streptomyces sp. NPDC015131]|uniref:pyridoxal-phosphate dependent enzyme n=1 Tax=Streptomyces sp. NPDC015131 TaxID=3364941 RepID=UPI0036F8AF5E